MEYLAPGGTLLVGRSAELGRLGDAVARVASGEPGLVLLTGVTGCGKTRLAAETLALAVAAGFDTFSGHGDEVGMAVAYAPFVEAFGTRLRGMDADARRDAVGDLPQLALVIGGLGVKAPRPLGDPSLERARLMDGFARLIDRLARRTPVAILIDDLPSIDNASGALLRHIALTVTDQPVLIVVTAQTDASDESPSDVVRLVAGIGDSSWWVQQLGIAPLNAADSSMLFAEVLGGPAGEELDSRVWELCAGRPLFIEAVGRRLVESDVLVPRAGRLVLSGSSLPMPTDVTAQLGLRLRLLTQDERQVIDVLAVSGGRCEYSLLADVCRLDEERLVSTLDVLCRRHLVEEDPESGAFGLVHGMLQSAALAELSSVQQRRMHAKLASALETRNPQDTRIVEHLIRAGTLVDTDDAIPKLRAAGRRARSLGSVDDAIRYLGVAVEITRRGQADESLADVLAELGELCLWAGRRSDAQEFWSEALSLYTAHGNPLGISKLNRELGRRAWTDGDADTARRHLAASARALSGLEPSVEHADLLYLQLTQASRIGDRATIVRNSRELRALATRLGLPALAVRATIAEGTRKITETDFVGAAHTLGRALDSAVKTDDPTLIDAVYNELSVVACVEGDLRSLRLYSEASLEIVRQLGATAIEPWPRMRLVIADLLCGDWDAALRGCSEVAAIVARFGEQRGQVSTFATIAWILVHRGRLAEARAALQTARDAAAPMRRTDAKLPSTFDVACVALALAEGDLDEAVAAGNRLADIRGSGWFALIAAMQYGDALAAAGLVDQVHALAGSIRAVRSSSTVLPDAAGNWLDGISTTGDAAAELMQRSTGQFEQLGFPFYAARARLAHAAAISGSHPIESTQLAGIALAGFDGLGAPIQAQQCRALLRSLGVVPSRGRARRDDPSPLSARELEVAQLVASGRTNAQVATELFISPRTVTTHLDRIYQRLGLNSRAALTRYMADSGLLEAAGGK